MEFYHGSKKVIRQPQVKGSDPKNDYGPSFYLTTNLTAGKSWACRHDSLGVVNQYFVNSREYKKLKILDLTDKTKHSVLNWLAILMHFRELDGGFVIEYAQLLQWLEQFYINVEDYDVIIGYRADDAYFRFPIRFISGNLALEDLEEIFLLGELGIQYAFMSKNAIELLQFKKAIECEEKFLGDYFKTVKEATKHFDEILNRPKDIKKHYIMDLMRGKDEI